MNKDDTYTIVYKPMGSHTWTLLHRDSHPTVADTWRSCADVVWSSDLLATMKRAQYLNSLNLTTVLGDGVSLDRLEFRHATVVLGDKPSAFGLYEPGQTV